MQRTRDLVWDGCLNVRDLGGHRTNDGGETRFGAVVRADSVRQLTESGWHALVDYGISSVVDLRGDYERDEDPPAAIDQKIEAVKARAGGAARTRDVYLIFLDHFKSNVAACVRAVAQAPEGGVVIHCVGGKDRTGLLTALLLHLTGVDVGQIAADYALSEERLRPREQLWLAAAETDAERHEIRQISRTPAEVIGGVFEHLTGRYGSIEGYLRAAGLQDEELELARARLRG